MKLPLIIGIVAILAVAATGLYVSDFTAYLGNDPSTCNNCHVMDTVYESWYHGSHQAWAGCNDCHTPHALIPKYIVKANSGYHHVTAFLFKEIPAAIRAKESSRQVIQENCIYCHKDTVESVADGQMDTGRYCFECHRDVAHGARGISLIPYRNEEADQ
jgi:cytochrome c nitrite reductase small subunit